MSDEKSKSKGIPGRQRQNMLFMLVGLVLGAIVTSGVFLVISRQNVPVFIPTPVPLPATMPPLPTFAPTPPSTLGAPGFMPQPTVIAKRISALGISPDGRRMLAMGWDNGTSFARYIEFAVSANLVGQEQSLALPNAYLANAVFSPDGTLLAIADDGYYSWLFALGDTFDAPVTELANFTGYHALAFSHDGKWLALGGSNGLRMIDVNNLALISAAQVVGTITAVAFSPDNQWIALGIADGMQARVQVVSAQDFNQVRYELYSGSYVTDLAFHPDGSVLAIAIDNVVQVFDLEIGGGYAYPLENLGRVRSIAFNPQGTWLAAAGGDSGGGMMGTIYTWQWSRTMTSGLDGWVNYRVLGGHAHDVTQLVFLPNGDYMLSASFDGSIRMWDYANTGLEISRLQL